MKVLIADKFEQSGREALEQDGFAIDYQPDLSSEALPAALAASAAVVLIVRSTKVPAAAFAATESLKLVVRAGAGYDTIDTVAAGARGVSVANCPGTNSTAVAELVLGLIISADRRIPSQVADLRAGKWDKKGYSKARGLKGSTLGIIGVGQIGRLVARRALAFEMKVIYHDVVACPELDEHPECQRLSMDEVFAQADVLSLHVPAIAETKHLVNARTLGLMKSHAVLVNTTRGSVVDEDALFAALSEDKIGFAAVDVFASEPAAADKVFANRLTDLPNFYGTHHVGASTDQAQNAVADLAVKIISHFKARGEVLCCVNSGQLKG